MTQWNTLAAGIPITRPRSKKQPVHARGNPLNFSDHTSDLHQYTKSKEIHTKTPPAIVCVKRSKKKEEIEQIFDQLNTASKR
jgi:hypothetical protein